MPYICHIHKLSPEAANSQSGQLLPRLLVILQTCFNMKLTSAHSRLLKCPHSLTVTWLLMQEASTFGLQLLSEGLLSPLLHR